MLLRHQGCVAGSSYVENKNRKMQFITCLHLLMRTQTTLLGLPNILRMLPNAKVRFANSAVFAIKQTTKKLLFEGVFEICD